MAEKSSHSSRSQVAGWPPPHRALPRKNQTLPYSLRPRLVGHSLFSHPKERKSQSRPVLFSAEVTQAQPIGGHRRHPHPAPASPCLSPSPRTGMPVGARASRAPQPVPVPLTPAGSGSAELGRVARRRHRRKCSQGSRGSRGPRSSRGPQRPGRISMAQAGQRRFSSRLLPGEVHRLCLESWRTLASGPAPAASPGDRTREKRRSGRGPASCPPPPRCSHCARSWLS